MAVDLEVDVDTRVSPSLHPQVVASMNDYDDDTKGVLGQVVTAFDTAYQGIRKVHDARAAAAQDPTMTEQAQLVRTQDMADRMFKQAAGALDKAHANLKANIALMETQLSAPVSTEAAGTYGKEIRAHVRGLADRQGASTLDKRPGQTALGFVRQAIEGGDHMTAAAVLGAPAYLSGITPDMQRTLTRMYREKHSPVEAKRLRAMQAALDMIHQRGPMLFTELEKAVGAPPHKVQALRAAKAKADKAFSL
ncbi:hypothetical protein [Gemmobacter sp.]|uniref:hypothetical protein n=1 Tax=Gemmobacter sp. TaxID=1898957 RepID=UPI002AFECA0F|nr:hypothetical protein [Gemmobacter sp.]